MKVVNIEKQNKLNGLNKIQSKLELTQELMDEMLGFHSELVIFTKWIIKQHPEIYKEFVKTHKK